MSAKGVKARNVRRYRRCVYCGAFTMRRAREGQPVTCPSHADLPALDPYHAPEMRATVSAAPARA